MTKKFLSDVDGFIDGLPGVKKEAFVLRTETSMTGMSLFVRIGGHWSQRGCNDDNGKTWISLPPSRKPFWDSEALEKALEGPYKTGKAKYEEISERRGTLILFEATPVVQSSSDAATVINGVRVP